jgi:site-specific DNA-methyltransferase (adenine-specific)
MIKLFNADCLDEMKNIKDKTIDLVLVDLPYGQTSCHWDIQIDLKLMWIELKRIGKDKCQYLFFTTTKYGIEIINSNKLWFRYDIVWEKTKSVGFLNANHMPLRAHEMIYIFSNAGTDDIELNRNIENRAYAKQIFEYINKPRKQIFEEFGNETLDHYFRFKSSQFGLPTVETYNKLITLYNIDKMEGFIKFENLKNDKTDKVIYNPQKTKGKPYKTQGGKYKNKDMYGKQKGSPAHENETGDRHPTTIVKFKGDVGLHRTQKPVLLCEWLLKSFSNEGALVLDFCMGSGTTGAACINTNRNFIGIEKDNDIFKIAQNRLIDILNAKNREITI